MTESAAPLAARLAEFAKLPVDAIELAQITAAQAACSEAADRLQEPAITFPWTFDLKEPARLGDGDNAIEVSSLEIQRPTAGHFLEFGVFDGTADGDRQLKMIAKLSNKALPVIRALPGTEMLRLMNRLTDFFQREAR